MRHRSHTGKFVGVADGMNQVKAESRRRALTSADFEGCCCLLRRQFLEISTEIGVNISVSPGHTPHVGLTRYFLAVQLN